MAVCCAFPAKPAHSTAASEPPARELPATAICALDAGAKSHEPSTTPTAATVLVVPRPAIQPMAGRAGFLTSLAPASRDRRSQPDMTVRPSRSPPLARPAETSRAQGRRLVVGGIGCVLGLRW